MKDLKEGYYELTISNGVKNFNTIELKDEKTKEIKKFKIIGTYKNGSIEERISWIKLKSENDVTQIWDRRIFDKDNEGEVFIRDILPQGEFFIYNSNPCYKKASSITRQEVMEESDKLRDIPNGMKLYRQKVESLIYASTLYFDIAKEMEPLILEDEGYSRESIQRTDKITKPGYYKLTLTDGISYHKTIPIDSEKEIPIIGKYSDGKMIIMGIDIIIEYIRDVEEIKDKSVIINNTVVDLPESDYHSHFNKPCYLKGKEITIKEVKKYLDLLKEDINLLTYYITFIQNIITSSTSNLLEVNSRNISNVTKVTKKPRGVNVYKNKKPNNKKRVSRKVKKKMKKSIANPAK